MQQNRASTDMDPTSLWRQGTSDPKVNYVSWQFGVAVNTGKTKCMEIGRHRGMRANAHIKIGSNSYEKVETFKYFKYSFHHVFNMRHSNE